METHSESEKGRLGLLARGRLLLTYFAPPEKRRAVRALPDVVAATSVVRLRVEIPARANASVYPRPPLPHLPLVPSSQDAVHAQTETT